MHCANNAGKTDNRNRYCPLWAGSIRSVTGSNPVGYTFYGLRVSLTSGAAFLCRAFKEIKVSLITVKFRIWFYGTRYFYSGLFFKFINMPTPYKLSKDTIYWVINIGYKDYTVAELVDLTGNKITFASMWQLLKKHNVKAITVQERAEQTILKMAERGKLKSALQAAHDTGICYRLVSKIIHKHKLPIKSKRAKNVLLNRWGKEPYKKPRQQKISEFELKKQKVMEMLNQTRAKW